MQLKMLETKQVTRGQQRYRYDEGKVFHFPISFAQQLLREGSAEEYVPATPKKKRAKKS